jgi:hypothetical protein
MYAAEIVNTNGKILVTIVSSVSSIRFSRAFHNICDAERWLIRLARTGLSKRACGHLMDCAFTLTELPALRTISVIDNRTVKRMALPSQFE